MRIPTLADAISLTGATSGTTLAVQSVTFGPLTGAQKTALVAFLNTLSIPGSTSNITEVVVTRQSSNTGGSITAIMTTVSGVVLPASAAVAIQNRALYDDIIGVVP